MKTQLAVIALLATSTLHAQDDLLSLLGEDSTTRVYTNASFKTTRVINSHSLESTAQGVLDVKISHRFGVLSDGIETFFGLDQASIRLGLDYGVSDRIMVGIGRSSYQKTVDGFVKYKILKQCDEGCGTPLTAALVAGMTVNTTVEEELPWYDTSRTDYFTHRLAYNFQLILGRKFTESLSLQLMPGLVHRNLVTTAEEANDVMNVGAAGRIKLTKRTALNAEYFYVLPGQLYGSTVSTDQVDDPNPGYHNSLSIGFDIETGGHVFQLHFTNSTGMFERSFITETTNSWSEGQIHYGFNISRVFTIRKPEAPDLDDWW